MQIHSDLSIDPELRRLLRDARVRSESVLREQRISFAFGQAMGSPLITKETVRRTAAHIRLVR